MIFPYLRYKVRPTPTIPSGEIYRPLIPIRIYGPTAVVDVFGLIDTGADNVFVSASVARALGIDMSGRVEQALGAGGHEIDVWPVSIEIEIERGKESYRWQANVGFLAGKDDPPLAYLGHSGFLEYFNAFFDTQDWWFELVPHENLAGHS
jgi:hypothetical protein